jgi:hypothetical protein
MFRKDNFITFSQFNSPVQEVTRKENLSAIEKSSKVGTKQPIIDFTFDESL